jgi:hypothetical protein
LILDWYAVCPVVLPIVVMIVEVLVAVAPVAEEGLTPVLASVP